LTPKGRATLKEELEDLVNVKRIELAAYLKEAVSQGDLKENADYHDAKEKQAFLEGRIKFLEDILLTAEVIESSGRTDLVEFGSHVTVRFDDEDDDETYMIVGAPEADPTKGKISYLSSLGEALMGKKKGEKISFRAPSGNTVALKVKKIN